MRELSGAEVAGDARAPASRTVLGSLLWLFAAGVTLAGAGATLFWILSVDDPQRLRALAPAAMLSLAATAMLLLLNVGLRWVRWHFLCRRADVRLAARDSLLVFLGTLPAVLTPFYLGELVRAPFVARRAPGRGWDVVAIWLLERSTDLLWVTIFMAVTRGPRFAAIAVLLVFSAVLLALRGACARARGGAFPGGATTALLLAISAPIAILPALSLGVGLALVGQTLSGAEVLGAYARSAVLGNLSGLPLGISVAGSTLVIELEALRVPLADAVVATWVFRVGTVWFAVAFGLVVATAYRRELAALLRRRSSTHFDALAPTYEHEIPVHVRDRLLERKTRIMRERLPAPSGDRPPRGLDVGCGHGWYACAMAQSGCEMTGVDVSAGQADAARRNAARAAVALSVEEASAVRLPFPDAHFDFAFAINVLHHLEDEDTRARALGEIVRVLRPGGVFFLLEINTANPLFRFYMSYVFPLIRAIDEGTERWISPLDLPPAPGARWETEIDYFTFLPDFLPEPLQARLERLERRLERSSLRRLSAHYMARLVRLPAERRLALGGDSARS